MKAKQETIQKQDDKYLVMTADSVEQIREYINLKARDGYAVVGNVAFTTYWKQYMVYHEYVVTMVKEKVALLP